MPFTAVRDIQIYYEVHGAGPRLLYISGTGADLRRAVNPFTSPLVQDFEILSYDQRGLGQSSRSDIPYTMADYAADADKLLEVVGWESCMVIGVSFGGMVAQELALRYPNRVKRLVLACTSSGGAGGSSCALHEMADLSEEERSRRSILLADTRRNERWLKKNRGEMEELVDQALAARQIGAGEPGREAGARRQLEARANHDTYGRLPDLDLPVFICGGRYDGIAPPDNAQAMQKQIRGARLELFDGGHRFLEQDPAAYKRIAAFLRGVIGSMSK